MPARCNSAMVVWWPIRPATAKPAPVPAIGQSRERKRRTAELNAKNAQGAKKSNAKAAKDALVARGSGRSKPAVFPCPLPQLRLPLACFGFIVEPIARPRQAERPVVLADGRRRIDAIRPAEHVLNRKQQQLRSRREQRLKQHVADLGIVRRGCKPGVGSNRLDRGQGGDHLPLV